ncbi:hypothetical protein EDC65_1966 [Stella humosa]|uniref:Uncharacterized protein n=1 Tax=Stella humosa TaxID=94 RepID=A0A3N1MBP6_9PROT|nr:hypothetical protein EDC65_1966 [Stella humosa]
MTLMHPNRWPIAALLSIACSTACSPDPELRLMTRIEPVAMRHPAALLDCQPEPPLPPPPRSVAAALAWIIESRAAGADCRARLACIRARQDGAGCAQD